MSGHRCFITEDRRKTEATAAGLPQLGADPAVTLLVYHRDGAQLVSLSSGKGMVIGRGSDADVSIQDRSLTRRHASFELVDDKVWVEDLGSTNGTQVNGRKVKRAQIRPGDNVYLGRVAVSVHMLVPADPLMQGIESHDRFMALLEEEVVRAKIFHRKLSVVMLRELSRKQAQFARWCPRVYQALRPVDRMAMYGQKAALISLPEVQFDEAVAFARSLIENADRKEPSLVCGVALCPDDAASAEELIEVVRTAAQKATSRHPVQSAQTIREEPNQVPASESRILVSARMKEIYELARRVADSTMPVLILGDTGTGKEVLTRAIHAWSKRRSHPLRCINCAAIPSQLIESVLFGHERGAFTGAIKQRKGIFEEADRGTIFLDEVGDLSAEAQATLLRVLETGQISRVGSAREITVDTRVIAATNSDLEARCKSGTFRPDLYYRLNTFTLKIPPLREHSEDILPLANHFMKQAAQANRCPVRRIDPVGQKLLLEYGWPGNVRELRNIIERAVVIADTDAIVPEDLPERIREQAVQLLAEEPSVTHHQGSAMERGDLRERVAGYERDLIVEALRISDWNQGTAAKALGIPVRTLVYKIRKYQIKSQKSRGKNRSQQ